MESLKITVERGTEKSGMKKAVVYCDTDTFLNGGVCSLGGTETASCNQELCCITCADIFECQEVCSRVKKTLGVA